MITTSGAISDDKVAINTTLEFQPKKHSISFYCIFIVYAEFLMFSLFYLYIVRNDDNKDDQSYFHRVSVLELHRMTQMYLSNPT